MLYFHDLLYRSFLIFLSLTLAFSLQSQISSTTPESRYFWQTNQNISSLKFNEAQKKSTNSAFLETIYLDMRIGQPGPAVGSQTLLANTSYIIQVSGTWSAWYTSTWSSYSGSPETLPIFPSPGVQNGKVGLDVAYAFAAPGGYGACDGPNIFPCQRKNKFLISLDGGSTWVPINPITSSYHANHVYEYVVVGKGFPPRFIWPDQYYPDDNYGVLKIDIASTNEIIFLNTYDSSNDGAAGPVSSSSIMRIGEYYPVSISGTLSIWPSAEWASVCKGLPEDSPQIPSTDRTNGKVGVDPYFIFAVSSIDSGSCNNGRSAPYIDGRLEISLDKGISWSSLVPIQTTYNPSHTYTYQVVGQGNSAQFRYVDNPTDDNYGILKIEIITAFLDLPVSYTNFSVAANGNYGGNHTGFVNSWFDHNPIGQIMTTWTGNTYTGAVATGLYTCNRESCYDGHNGIDFRNTQSNELIYAAANGTAFGVVINCKISDSGCTGYGNRVWIDHHNGYATLYGHLSAVSVTNDTKITDRLGQPIGVMGSTGKSTGVHLHFGVYYDQNGDGKWSENEAVDPYGYQRANYLWIHSLSTQQQIGSLGGNVSTPSGNSMVIVPAGAISSPVTLELWDIPPVAKASATLRSTGNSFWIRVLEGLTGVSSSLHMLSASTNSFDLPVIVIVQYDSFALPHLNVNQLTIYQWDEVGRAWVALPTSLDTVNYQASALTSQTGNFDLQAPLVCPADTREPNDNYDEASMVQTDGTLVSNLFDIAQDEDWVSLDAKAGWKYIVQTSNLAAGVDTKVEVFNQDGITIFASDDDSGGGSASKLVWHAPTNGTYFLRVSQGNGSAFGCSAIYNISVKGEGQLYLPIISR